MGTSRNGQSVAIQRSKPRRTNGTGNAAEAGGIRHSAGFRVLDIAAGAGDQSPAAALIVGPGGCVLATDLSAPMLKVVEEAAQRDGLSNVGTKVMYAQHIVLELESFVSQT